jgi:hypothetical protein
MYHAIDLGHLNCVQTLFEHGGTIGNHSHLLPDFSRRYVKLMLHKLVKRARACLLKQLPACMEMIVESYWMCENDIDSMDTLADSLFRKHV